MIFRLCLLPKKFCSIMSSRTVLNYWRMLHDYFNYFYENLLLFFLFPRSVLGKTLNKEDIKNC